MENFLETGGPESLNEAFLVVCVKFCKSISESFWFCLFPVAGPVEIVDKTE